MSIWKRAVQLKSWAISNFWNIFSFIGVIATLYLGFFYVPDYVEELGLNKQKLTHQELMADIQELVFYEQPITLDDVEDIIKGKELANSVKYSFTSIELLTQIQNDFLQNKFIPLEKRNELIVSLKKLRSEYQPPDRLPNEKVNVSAWMSILIGGVTGIISLLAVVSIISKLRSDRETEVDISSSINISGGSGNVIYNSNSYRTSHEYELMVGEIIEELNLDKSEQINSLEHSYDYLLTIANKECIVEVKAYSKLLGLGTAKEFLNVVHKTNKMGILIAKSGLTKRALELIDAHNQLTDSCKIYVVTGSSKQEVKSSLYNLTQSF